MIPRNENSKIHVKSKLTFEGQPTIVSCLYQIIMKYFKYYLRLIKDIFMRKEIINKIRKFYKWS